MHSLSPLQDILVLFKAVEQYAESGISTDCAIAAMVRSMLHHIPSLLSRRKGLGMRLFTPISFSSQPPPSPPPPPLLLLFHCLQLGVPVCNALLAYGEERYSEVR